MNRKPFPEEPLRGYAEGYYGRLLSWGERSRILQTLEALSMNAWLYAPKEDPCHRLRWRENWDEHWASYFSRFCTECRAKRIHVIAGLAPGLDFDFASLGADGSRDANSSDADTACVGDANKSASDDYSILLEKARFLLDAGAAYIGLLMDDIDPDFDQRSGQFQSEGSAHATLANRLGNDLNVCVLVVPRIYANELVVEDPDYLPDFARVLDVCHLISHCGDSVVSRVISPEVCNLHLGNKGHRILVWDNLYANDYCPRRLFTGEWTGRETVADILLNPTGMPFTDQLLLEMMAIGQQSVECSESAVTQGDHVSEQDIASGVSSTGVGASAAPSAAWRLLMDRYGVPRAFDSVADYCWHPYCNGDTWIPIQAEKVPIATIEKAINELLWRWKSPLAREWYPYLMGLKQDLTRRSGHLPDMRIMKTQTSAMASELLDLRSQTL